MQIIVMVGVAGSGKSSYIIEKMDEHSVWISSDNIREEFRKENLEFTNEKVFSTMFERVKKEIANNTKTIFYDATNISRKKRTHLYNQLKSVSDYEVKIVCVLKSLNTCLMQNSKREGVARVPDDVIVRMYKSLEIPKVGLDCDTYEVISEHYLDFFSEFTDLDIEHKSSYHKETIKQHIEMCVENAVKYSKNNDIEQETMLDLITIASVHDLGKIICREDKGKFCSYINHEKVSAMYYVAFSKKLDIISETVYQHMNNHLIENNKMDENKWKQKHKISDEELKMIKMFGYIDNISRIV